MQLSKLCTSYDMQVHVLADSDQVWNIFSSPNKDVLLLTLAGYLGLPGSRHPCLQNLHHQHTGQGHPRDDSNIPIIVSILHGNFRKIYQFINH